MNREVLMIESEERQEALWELRECLLISQNSHLAMTAILRKFDEDSSALNVGVIEILQEEILVMNTVIDRMHRSVQKRLALTIQTS